MKSEELSQNIITFFEKIEKYYGCKTDISEGLFSDINNQESHFTTWNISEFELIRSAYRSKGERFMLEGKGAYYEISAKNIVAFKQLGRNKFEFIEQYSATVFRISKIRFHYKY